jgi:prepilin-type N-terminal cleavage/methylation domain-containing protein
VIAAARQRPRQAGMTLIELMVSLIVTAIVVGGMFRVYTTSSTSMRSQTKISELQQTVRAAREKLIYDLRMAGYFSSSVQSLVDGTGGGFGGGGGAGIPAGTFLFSPVAIVNGDDAASGDMKLPDQLRIVYADTSCSAHVQTSGPPFNSAVTTVDSVGCFADGDVAIAVEDGGPLVGQGCVLKITHVVPGGPKLQHNQGQGAPWNDNQNHQCDNISGVWADGHTVFMKFQARAYRIKPNDFRGVLQMSPSGGLVANDWQDLATGIVDLQFAVRVYDQASLVDSDGDGDPQRNWLSGENMEANLFNGTAKMPIAVRMTIIGRTTTEIDGPPPASTIPVIRAVAPMTAANNDTGDQPGRALPLSPADPKCAGAGQWPWNMYCGNYVYRQTSTIIDLRNIGVGN